MIEKESYQYDSTFVTQYLDQQLKKRNFIEKKKRVTEYYPGYSIKKITSYKNEKPVYYSVFDCNPLGENHKVKKDSVYNCVKYDLDSLGNKMKITIVNNRRFPEKTIEYFDKDDALIAQKTFNLKSNRLDRIYYFKPGAPGFTKFISFTNKREYFRVENTYDGKETKNCTEILVYKRGRLRDKDVKKFNDRNLLEQSTLFNRRNKKKIEWTYLYEYY